jgi:hypothetical protein
LSIIFIVLCIIHLLFIGIHRDLSVEASYISVIKVIDRDYPYSISNVDDNIFILLIFIISWLMSISFQIVDNSYF